MPRSASRMTWQIAKLFSPPEPAGWQEMMKRGNMVPTQRPEPWPYRSHDFIPGMDPVIYTYRDPIEAFLSLYSRVMQDPELCNEDTESRYLRCITEILPHQQILKKLVNQHKRGRSLLLMRYEEYFGNDEKRVRDIGKFLKVDVSQERIFQIIDDVSLDRNITRSRAGPALSPLNSFSKWEDLESGMQADHINEKTRGRVGEYQRHFPGEMDLILKADNTEVFGRLRLFAQELGYNY